MTWMRTAERFFSWSSVACVMLAAAGYVVVPMRAAQNWFVKHSIRIENYERLGVFAILFCAIVSILLSRFFGSLRDARATQSPLAGEIRKCPRWLTLLMVVASVYLAVRTTYQVLYGPLDTDETYISISFLETSPWEVINPLLTTRNHGLSTLLGYLSCETFGYSEMAVRYPAIFFTVVFLVLLFYFCRRFGSPLSTVLIYGNLVSNQVTLWYMHSMRGYIPMMVFALGMLFIVLGALESPQKLSRWKLALFGSLSALLCLTHTFGGFYCAFLSLALLAWLGTYGRKAPREIFHNGLRLFFVSLLAAPIIIGISACQAVVIKGLGFFNNGGFPQMNMETVRFLGIPDSRWLPTLQLILAVLVFGRMKIKTEAPRTSILTVFLGVSALSLAGIAWGLEVVRLEARMMLAFFIPLLYWFGEALNDLPWKAARVPAVAVPLFLLLAIPTRGTPSLYQVAPEILADYKAFIQKVRDLTHPTDKICYTAAGAEWEVRWTEGLYLVQSSPKRRSQHCDRNYHLFFETGYDDSLKPQAPATGQYVPIYADGRGRHLFEHVPAHPGVALNN